MIDSSDLGLADQVTRVVVDALSPTLTIVDTETVPTAHDAARPDGATRITATYFYADMADSTGLAQAHESWMVAKIVRSYLSAVTRVVRERSGQVMSLDGDRVLAVFTGERKNANAVLAAMNLSWAVSKVINPALERKWGVFGWTMQHGVGIDTGEALIVRGGVGADDDLVCVGRAPNIAAKLSKIRSGESIFVTKPVLDDLPDHMRRAASGDMWNALGTQLYGRSRVTYYGSWYYWRP
jgi:uridylate cyclase